MKKQLQHAIRNNIRILLETTTSSGLLILYQHALTELEKPHD